MTRRIVSALTCCLLFPLTAVSATPNATASGLIVHIADGGIPTNGPEDVFYFRGDITVTEARYYPNGMTLGLRTPENLTMSLNVVGLGAPAKTRSPMDGTNSVQRALERLRGGSKVSGLYISCARGTPYFEGLSAQGASVSSNYHTDVFITRNSEQDVDASGGGGCRVYSLELSPIDS